MRWLNISHRINLWIRYFDHKDLRRLSLLIENGHVIDVREGFEKFGETDLFFDLSRGVALPGFIDIHTHVRGLELSYKEDERSGTMAAAKGGFTMIIDMPNTRPRVDNIDVLKNKLKAFERNSFTEYGIWIALPKEEREAIEMMRFSKVYGLKIYPEDYERLEKYDREVLRKIPRIMIHAEDPENISESCEKGYRWRCRPIDAEIKALERIHRVLGSRDGVNITHVTNLYTAYVAKKLGYSTDTCPHYLLLDSDDERRLGCVAKVNPPLRTKYMREHLLENLVSSESLIDMMSTDHAPHTFEEKNRDFSECPSGISSIEFVSSLMLDLVNKNVLSLERLISLFSIGPAKFLGLDLYGCVKPGCRANYTIIDLDKEIVVRSSQMISKSKNTPYENMRLKGSVYATVVRGVPVYLNDLFTDPRDYEVAL
jgi:dihydroorotase